MTTPPHTLRVVFALSAFTCAAILVLFVRGRAEWTAGFWFQLAAISAALCAAACLVTFRRGGLRLDGTPLMDAALVFLRHLVFAYVALAFLVTALAMAIAYTVTRSAPNALALAVLAGLWLSLWIAPGIAAVTSWRRLRGAKPQAA